jgi:hypothetical protein
MSRPWWEVSGRPVCFWSTYRFEEGANVQNGVFRLFTTCVGQAGQGFLRGTSRAETNLMKAGQTGLSQAVVFHKLRWTPQWDGDEDLTPMEQLARVGYDSPEAGLNRFWHHAALDWDTIQMRFPLAPVLQAEVPLVTVAKPNDPFSVLLTMGPSAPRVPLGVRLRAVLWGVAVDPQHVQSTLESFGRRYRAGKRPLDEKPGLPGEDA